MRGIMKTSSRPLQEIFNEFDVDGNGVVTVVEFRNAIRKLNLGLSSKEIDQLMMRIDANSDGMIDYSEFTNKFGTVDNQSQLM
jgi:Ca2+-binding EF-hand superfamily protein